MLTDSEPDCLARYCALLARRLPDLVAVRMFGSAARATCGRTAEQVAARSEFLERVADEGVDVWSWR